MNTPFKSALAFSESAIMPLAARIRKHLALLQIIRSALPGALAVRVADCVVSGQKLILYSDSAVWASQLRFHSAAVLAAAKAHGNDTLEKVVMRIQPPAAEHTALRRKPQLPAQAQIEALRIAASRHDHDALQQALARLGATLERLQVEEAAERGA